MDCAHVKRNEPEKFCFLKVYFSSKQIILEPKLGQLLIPAHFLSDGNI